MTLFKEWDNLIREERDQGQFNIFWKEYSEAEMTIYADILSHHKEPMSGKIGELAEKYKVRPVMFMGFLDGIQSSLNKPFALDDLDLESQIDLDIDFEKLYFNMHDAGAEHLYGLEEWTKVFDMDKLEEIYKAYKQSKTFHRAQPKIGRNDPCPCGSGKKYKHCCMKKDQGLA